MRRRRRAAAAAGRTNNGGRRSGRAFAAGAPEGLRGRGAARSCPQFNREATASCSLSARSASSAGSVSPRSTHCSQRSPGCSLSGPHRSPGSAGSVNSSIPLRLNTWRSAAEAGKVPRSRAERRLSGQRHVGGGTRGHGRRHRQQARCPACSRLDPNLVSRWCSRCVRECVASYVLRCAAGKPPVRCDACAHSLEGSQSHPAAPTCPPPMCCLVSTCYTSEGVTR